MTTDAITRHLTADHARLEALLDAATRREPYDPAPYAEFRRGLLRHIGIEEKLLLPAAQEAAGGTPLEVAARLRLDHGAIAALLVPTPTPVIVATLRHILERHNPIEEGAGGLYAQCDRLLAARSDEIVAAMESYPEVPVSPHNDSPRVMPAVERALERAGYALVTAS
ncbi:MAG: hemerythrin domain-containing protein [Thermodesulfobacteriota bacterium]